MSLLALGDAHDAKMRSRRFHRRQQVPFCSDSAAVSSPQEEQAREDAKTLAILEEQARTELERRQNQAASQIQRVMKEYVLRQIANKGKGKKGGGKGKGGKKKKK